MMLCSKCQEMFDARLKVTGVLAGIRDEFHHYHDLESLKRAAKVCQICAHTVHRILSLREIDQGGVLKLSCNLEGEHPYNDIYLWTYANGILAGIIQLSLASQLSTPQEKHAVNTGSETSLAFVQQCLRTCRESHAYCSASAPANTWYPTRLIDVRYFTETGFVRLALSDSHQVAGHYATLSHRWNPDTPQMSPSDFDLVCLKEGILIKNISPVFRDAIAVTFRLGIHYIWIDSLCIIQGASKEAIEDWQNESSRMGEVYKNAYLNIFATGTASPHGGIFADRDPVKMDLSPRLVNWVTESGQLLTGQYTLEPTAQSQRISRREFGSHTYTRLLNRGWVFQERFLGPRIVHFGTEELIFECHDSTKCEGTNDSSVMSSRSFFEPNQGSDTNGQPGELMQEFRTCDGHLRNSAYWLTTVVEIYSACQFTYESDRLVALSGVAKEFALICGISDLANNYFAGHWRDLLPFSLLWYIEDLSNGSKEQDRVILSDRALPEDLPTTPSWSWLSAHSKVEELGSMIYKGVIESHVMMVSAHMDLMSPDATGQIRTGRLKLEVSLAKLACATILSAESSSGVSSWSQLVCEQCPNLSCKLDTIHLSSLAGKFWCAPVKTSEGGNSRVLVNGLLLQKTGGQHNEFRRIGVFRVDSGEHEVSFLFHDTERIFLI